MENDINKNLSILYIKYYLFIIHNTLYISIFILIVVYLLINCLYLYISGSLKMYNSELISCIQGISQILWNIYS